MADEPTHEQEQKDDEAKELQDLEPESEDAESVKGGAEGDSFVRAMSR